MVPPLEHKYTPNFLRGSQCRALDDGTLMDSFLFDANKSCVSLASATSSVIPTVTVAAGSSPARVTRFGDSRSVPPIMNYAIPRRNIYVYPTQICRNFKEQLY